MRAAESPARRSNAWLGMIALVSLAAVAAALVSQHVFDMQPCPWCVLQRVIERHATRRRTGGTGLGAQRPTRDTAPARPAPPEEDIALVSTMRRS